MVSNGIKTAQIQAKNSPLNSSWEAEAFPTQNVFSAIRNAAVRRPSAGRHASPAKGSIAPSRHVPKHAAL